MLASSQKPTHSQAVLLALTVTFLWSTSWILIRWGLDDDDLDPLAFAALRYGVAATVLLAWTMRRSDTRVAIRSLDRRAMGLIVVLGVVMYSLTQGAQFVAIDRQPAATTSLVLSATPLVVGFASSRALGEVPSARQLVGGGLVAGGAALYFAGSLGATTVGMIAAVVALASNSTASLLGRNVNRRQLIPSAQLTALSMAVGAALLVAVSLAIEGIPDVTARGWLIVAWLAVVNTALAFTWWNHSLRSLSAVESAGINNTMLAQIALLAWLFLDESPGLVGWVGLAVASTGVLLTQLSAANRR